MSDDRKPYDPVRYRLQPYSTAYPCGTLAVSRMPGRTGEGRIAYACAIAWTGDAEQLRPRIVFDEIVSSGVGDEYDPDRIAASALNFACYTESSTEGTPDAYGCAPAQAWREWVESHGEYVDGLRYADEDGDGESLVHLRMPGQIGPWSELD